MRGWTAEIIEDVKMPSKKQNNGTSSAISNFGGQTEAGGIFNGCKWTNQRPLNERLRQAPRIDCQFKISD
jgi:hypothetical protein